MGLLLSFALIASLAACGEHVPKPRTAQVPVPTTQVMGGPALRDPEALREVDDTRIVAQIKRQLVADPELGEFVIDVDSKDGLVVLSGVAPSEAARERASVIARNLPNVQDIANQLAIKENPES